MIKNPSKIDKDMADFKEKINLLKEKMQKIWYIHYYDPYEQFYNILFLKLLLYDYSAIPHSWSSLQLIRLTECICFWSYAIIIWIANELGYYWCNINNQI